MTDKIINADALLRWIKATKGSFDDETLEDFYLSTIEKINELSLDVPKQYVDVNVLKNTLLKITFPREYGFMPYYKQIMDKILSVIDSIATPAPVAQENIKFDDIVDLIEKLKADSFNSINEGKTYFPPQGIKAQEVFEHTLCIFENDFLRYYNDLIKNKSPAPVAQDGDWWCWDMKLAPSEYIAHNGCRLAYVENDAITPLGDICAFDEEYFRKTIKAWRPLPPIPTRGDL